MRPKKTGTAFFAMTALCLVCTAAVRAGDARARRTQPTPPDNRRAIAAKTDAGKDSGQSSTTRSGTRHGWKSWWSRRSGRCRRPRHVSSTPRTSRSARTRPSCRSSTTSPGCWSPSTRVAPRRRSGSCAASTPTTAPTSPSTPTSMPINMVTHAHGQGYADPNFLIPETIDRVELYKGPYFPQFGDFATAGALKLITKETFKENFALAEGGSFDTSATSLGASPQLGTVKTLFAGQAYYTNGPFINPEHLAQATMAMAGLDARPRRRTRSCRQRCRATPPTGTARGRYPRAAVASGTLDQLRLHRPDRGRSHRPPEPAPRLALHAERDGHLGGPHATRTRYKLRLWSELHVLRQQRPAVRAVPERRDRGHRRRPGAAEREVHPR